MLFKAKTVFVTFLKRGTSREIPTEKNQRIFVANLFSFIGYLLTGVLSINAFFNNEMALGISLFVSAMLFSFGHYLNGATLVSNPLKISSVLIVLCLMVLMIYLVYAGGHSNTGPLWIYLVPPVLFYFGGLKHGSLLLSAFTTIITIMLFFPDNLLLATIYGNELKLRLFLSFITVTILFGFYEFSRQESIKRIQKLSDMYEQQAMHDTLTHLPNRRGMKEYIQHEYDRSLRSGKTLSFLLCDIDYFKQINDVYGHDAGDFILLKVAELLRGTIRKQDKIARWGGEEFLFLLPETNLNEAYLIAEKLRILLSKTNFIYNNKHLKVTMSVGAEALEDKNIDQAINTADKLLYQAKQAGRNQTYPRVNSEFSQKT